MFTKEQIKEQIRQMGIKPDDTVLIHTSMKAVGEVENGADGLIDAFCEVLTDGLFLVPTHTWGCVNRKQPVYDVRSTVPNIGVVPRVAAFRKDGIRSLHATHSIWAHGRDAEAFIQGEENAQTPCPVGGAWNRLSERKAKILLLGVGHGRNTFIHAVDEVADLPNRLSPNTYEVTCIDWNGVEHRHLQRPHAGAFSDYFVNLEEALVDQGAQTFGRLGNAEVRIVDAKKCQEVLLRIYSRTQDYDGLLSYCTIPESMYREEKIMKDANCGYCMRGELLDKFGIHICDLSVSSLILFKEQSHPGRCIVAYKDHVSEIVNLTDEERNAFFADVNRAAKAIHAAFHPDKVNYGAYGDTGCHLHFHLVPKYKDGYEWGGVFAMNPGEKLLTEAEYAEMIEKIKANL